MLLLIARATSDGSDPYPLCANRSKSRLLKCLISLYGKQCGPDQTAPIGAVCSGSSLFASMLNSSVMLGSYLQQTTSADDNFRCIIFLAL